ncbi:MAG: hypothetical protein N4A33_09035 [Bacteriovoracaceae bacterium]|jgi:hypothetical protein|nr:hypothetical protein [Bacteriovoracaceae bacterium]
MIKTILYAFIISYSVFAQYCNYNIDVKSYEHGDIKLDLHALTKKAMDKKGYIYQIKKSAFRSNIKIRILKKDEKEQISLFYNLYRYRKHLIHYYEPEDCKEELCSSDEVNMVIGRLLAKIRKEVPYCRSLK